MAELHIPLLVVLGHQHCGAVKADIDELGGHGEAEADIKYLVGALAPAVENGKRLGETFGSRRDGRRLRCRWIA